MLQQRKYHELTGDELGKDNAALIAACGGKLFLRPLDLENLGLSPRRWKKHCLQFQN